ncbi:LAMI_0H14906g1_1 [Lachancea mirantina]|uniref:LAMI_0H14906g1_1 n=1 Tax=Lachancea mirantina TaxID=1230905 RepID=A0A1G4KI99_9SACH|nr:LAMI_0H14906g1_1 [Lachancea mirantina]
MRYSRTLSKDSKSSSDVSAPAESVTKWKIPHYYRRSSPNNGTSKSEKQNSASSDATKDGNNINIMRTPRPIQLDDSSSQGSKKGPLSKTKKGEMVFVNYTVKDSKPSETTTLKKKKSHRSRMLKIFGSSTSIVDEESRESSESFDTFERSNSSTDASTSNVSSPPFPTSKRNYASFLRCSKLNASSPAVYTTDLTSPQETVPKSTPSPGNQRPALRRSISSNVSLVNNFGRASVEMAFQNQRYGANPSQVENLEDEEFDHHYLDQYQNNGDPTGSHFASNPHWNSQNTTTALRPAGTVEKGVGDENDASIAFSKMFTRKRANTGGSMGSFISSNASGNVSSSLHRNLSTNSVSSMAHRYSPNRAGSPTKNLPLLRTTSNRASREISYHPPPVHLGSEVGYKTETYLDSHTKHRNSHRRKNESISELQRLQTTGTGVYSSALSAHSSASTPCLDSLSSGISSIEKPGANFLTLERESSLENDVFEEQETDFIPNQPALREIPTSTRELEGEFDSSGTIFSAMTASQSTLNSSVVSYRSLQTAESNLVPADQNSRPDLYHKNLNEHRTDSQGAQSSFTGLSNDEFINPQHEFLMDANTATLSHFSGPLQSDNATVTSNFDTSPSTITTFNHLNMGSGTQDENHFPIDNHNHGNFTSRILHDIDLIAQSISGAENDKGLQNW